MRIVVDTDAGGSTLEDPDVLDAFHVEVSGNGDLEVALAPFGRIDGDHAWIRVDMVRAAARERVEVGWDQRFEAMLDYARSKGWLDEGGTAIRAHIERA